MKGIRAAIAKVRLEQEQRMVHGIEFGVANRPERGVRGDRPTDPPGAGTLQVEDMDLRKKGEAGQNAIETSQVEVERDDGDADASQSESESESETVPADEPPPAPTDAEN